jgi:hypothetical protein
MSSDLAPIPAPPSSMSSAQQPRVRRSFVAGASSLLASFATYCVVCRVVSPAEYGRSSIVLATLGRATPSAHVGFTGSDGGVNCRKARATPGRRTRVGWSRPAARDRLIESNRRTTARSSSVLGDVRAPSRNCSQRMAPQSTDLDLSDPTRCRNRTARKRRTQFVLPTRTPDNASYVTLC